MNFELLRKKIETIGVIFVAVILVAIAASAFLPLKYSAKSKVLVVQNFPASADAYAVSLSNEYISSILAGVVRVDTFYGEVVNIDNGIDKTYFTKNSNDHELEMLQWQKAVKARAINDTGIIEISVKHSDKDQALKINSAINKVLVEKNQLFHGGGNNVAVKIVDEPAVSILQFKIVFNIIAAIIIGLALGIGYAYAFPGEEYDLRVLKK